LQINRESWKTVAVGDLVVIKEDNMPPLQWPLGRVVTVHIGQDGAIRVVNIRTSVDEITTRQSRGTRRSEKNVKRSPRLCVNSYSCWPLPTTPKPSRSLQNLQ